jgi:hypothetical protein
MLLAEAVRFAHTSVNLCHSTRRYFLAQSPPLEPENLIVNLISYSGSFLVFITIAPSNWCSIHIDNCRSSGYTYKITFYSFCFDLSRRNCWKTGLFIFCFVVVCCEEIVWWRQRYFCAFWCSFCLCLEIVGWRRVHFVHFVTTNVQL